MSSHEWIYIAIVITALILITMPAQRRCSNSQRYVGILSRDNVVRTEDLMEVEIEPAARKSLNTDQPDCIGGMWHAEPSHAPVYKKIDIDDSNLAHSLKGGSDPSVDSSYIRFSCY